MILFQKRNGGLEIDYLIVRIFRFKIWVTHSIYFNKFLRIILWKLSKDLQSVDYTRSIKFG